MLQIPPFANILPLPILKNKCSLKNKLDMKIEIKITDEAGNVQLYDVSGSLVSPKSIQKEAEKYQQATSNKRERYGLEVCFYPMTANGLGLCEGKELELQMLKISTNVE